MRNANSHQFSRIVELSDGVEVCTSIKSTYLPALRSGFAGYPLNPRWSASKIVAWKLGQQWRLEFQQGKLSLMPNATPWIETKGGLQAAAGCHEAACVFSGKRA